MQLHMDMSIHTAHGLVLVHNERQEIPRSRRSAEIAHYVTYTATDSRSYHYWLAMHHHDLRFNSKYELQGRVKRENRERQVRSSFQSKNTNSLDIFQVPTRLSMGWFANKAVKHNRSAKNIENLGTIRTLWIVNSGNSVFASSFVTEGCTITSSPFFQLTGVVTRCLSPIWRA